MFFCGYWANTNIWLHSSMSVDSSGWIPAVKRSTFDGLCNLGKDHFIWWGNMLKLFHTSGHSVSGVHWGKGGGAFWLHKVFQSLSYCVRLILAYNDVTKAAQLMQNWQFSWCAFMPYPGTHGVKVMSSSCTAMVFVEMLKTSSLVADWHLQIPNCTSFLVWQVELYLVIVIIPAVFLQQDKKVFITTYFVVKQVC